MELTSISTKETFKITRSKQFQLWKQNRVHINVSAKDSQRFLNYIRNVSDISKRVFNVTDRNRLEHSIIVKGLKFKEFTLWKKAHVSLRCLELNNLQVLQAMNGLDTEMFGMHGDKTYERHLKGLK